MERAGFRAMTSFLRRNPHGEGLLSFDRFQNCYEAVSSAAVAGGLVATILRASETPVGCEILLIGARFFRRCIARDLGLQVILQGTLIAQLMPSLSERDFNRNRFVTLGARRCPSSQRACRGSRVLAY